MSTPQPPGPHHRLPTLTEVLESPGEAAAAAPAPAAEPEAAQALVERVLEGVQRRIEVVLEQRVREALAPVLARAAEQVVRSGEEELARVLRTLVGEALAAELKRLPPAPAAPPGDQG